MLLERTCTAMLTRNKYKNIPEDIKWMSKHYLISYVHFFFYGEKLKIIYVEVRDSKG